MELLLKRVQLDPDVTIGELYVNGRFESFTVEDTVRPDGEKVYGKTAIPYGTYKIVITMSNRFKRLLPLLLNVPNFDGIRIHPGNTAADTDGCILPGADRLAKGVGKSRLAFDLLFGKLQAAESRCEQITIDITRG